MYVSDRGQSKRPVNYHFLKAPFYVCADRYIICADFFYASPENLLSFARFKCTSHQCTSHLDEINIHAWSIERQIDEWALVILLLF